jgi:hypothetical protein
MVVAQAGHQLFLGTHQQVVEVAEHTVLVVVELQVHQVLTVVVVHRL